MPELVGASPAIQVLRKQVRRYAKVSDPVLILGSTGTGKESWSPVPCNNEGPRAAGGPFLAVNVGGVPEELAGCRDVRCTQGRLHRRALPTRLVPQRPRRHALPRRDRRGAAQRAGIAAPRPRNGPRAADRRIRRGRGRHSRRRRHRRRPAGRAPRAESLQATAACIDSAPSVSSSPVWRSGARTSADLPVISPATAARRARLEPSSHSPPR